MIKNSNMHSEQWMGPILGYYVRYDRLVQLINTAFVGSTATTIDIFIDLHSIYKDTLSVMKYKPNERMNNDLFITSGIINLCAHYREFFMSRYSTQSRFWLIDVQDVNKHSLNCAKYSISDIQATNFQDIMQANTEILNILVSFLPNITMIKPNGFDLGVNVLDIVCKEQLLGNDNPRLIITKDKHNLLIGDAIANTFVLRPKKEFPSDNSELIVPNNIIYSYINHEFRKTTQLPLSYGMGSVLAALSKDSSRHLTSALRIDTAIKKLSTLYDPNYVRPHVWDIKSLITQLGIDVDPYLIESRYKAIDIPIMYEMFRLDPAYRVYTGISNLWAPDQVKEINEKYFSDIPLDTLVL